MFAGFETSNTLTQAGQEAVSRLSRKREREVVAPSRPPSYTGGMTPPDTRNHLFYGDNLDVLRRKIGSGTVDLCYIDPPFNSKRNYFQIYNNQGSEDRAQA